MTAFITIGAIAFAVFTVIAVLGTVLAIRSHVKELPGIATVGAVIAIIGTISSVIVGSTLVDRLGDFARIEVYADAVIQVLNEHGIAETCEHLPCDKLFSSLENLPTSLEVEVK